MIPCDIGVVSTGSSRGEYLRRLSRIGRRFLCDVEPFWLPHFAAEHVSSWLVAAGTTDCISSFSSTGFVWTSDCRTCETLNLPRRPICDHSYC